VVVLTTSRADEDIVSSYARHANAYVSKPVEAAGFMRVIRQIDNFFAQVAELPR
jgi:DNA-binding NarL/FixJ family response regulator